MNIIPPSLPKLTRKELMKAIKTAHPDFSMPDLFFVGIRGYYLNTMGETGKNDRMLYDDAIFIVTKDELIPFNGNTDPSAFKTGVAVLQPGVWKSYQFGYHRGQYLAFKQTGGPVTLLRDGKGEDTGYFGINIHKGGETVTGSLGCQTIPRSQWDGFISKATELAKKYYSNRYRSVIYTYVLLENKPAVEQAEQTLG